jgi:hypothetical protein
MAQLLYWEPSALSRMLRARVKSVIDLSLSALESPADEQSYPLYQFAIPFYGLFYALLYERYTHCVFHSQSFLHLITPDEEARVRNASACISVWPCSTRLSGVLSLRTSYIHRQ